MACCGELCKISEMIWHFALFTSRLDNSTPGAASGLCATIFLWWCRFTLRQMALTSKLLGCLYITFSILFSIPLTLIFRKRVSS
jgi:hypothetical protein